MYFVENFHGFQKLGIEWLFLWSKTQFVSNNIVIIIVFLSFISIKYWQAVFSVIKMILGLV